MQHLKLVVFDLDGTLLNTLSDLAHSANYALQQSGFPTHPIEVYPFFIGNGLHLFIERILPENQKTEQTLVHVKELFLSYYDAHIADHTQPYNGITDLLKSLLSKGLKLAVASNKHQQGTEKLIRTLLPDFPFIAVLGQSKDIPAKPNPAMVREILKIAGLSPEETIYIGDSDVDIFTASNCGVRSIGVTWGYRPREELEAAGANFIVDSPDEIFEIITT